MGALSGLTIGGYVIGVLFGGMGCLIAAGIVRVVVRRFAPGKVWPRVAFWGVFGALFGWVLWALFVPPVNFEMEFVSPDGSSRLHLADITDGMTYDDLGWRLKARLDDAQTGNCLGEMMVRHWHSGFDDVEPVMPTPDNVRVSWSKNSRSVMIRFGWAYGILPEDDTATEHDDPKLLDRFPIKTPADAGPMPLCY